MFGRRRTLNALITLVAAAGLVVVGPAEPAAAVGQRGSAFVWNYWAAPPLGEPYTPYGEYQYNSTSPGAPNNQIRRDGTGRYSVAIPGVIGFAVTHITAYGWDAAYCNGGSAWTGDSEQLLVECYTAGGVPVDHMFTLSVTSVAEYSPAQMAYMIVEDNGSIFSGLHFNSDGRFSTVTRQGYTYVVRIPGLGSAFGHVQVTGADHGSRCTVAGWYQSGEDELVLVNCWLRGGFTPTNAPFNLTYVNQQNILGLPAGVPPDGHPSAYAWADQPYADEYPPHPFYQYASSGYEPTAGRGDAGRYLMTFTGVDLNNGNIQVSAYGDGSQFCVVNYWSGRNVQVQCYTYQGIPSDTFYTVAFTGL